MNRSYLSPLLGPALLLLLSLVLAACADDASPEALSELVLLVDTDLPVPAVVDAVQIETTEPGGGEHTVLVALSGEDADSLPGSLALRHSDGPMGPVRVKAKALHGSRVILTREAEVSFQPGRTVSLTLSLLAECALTQCEGGQTCAAGGCRDVAVSSDELRDYAGLPSPQVAVDFDAAVLDIQIQGGPDGGISGDPLLNTACSDDPCDPLSVCTPMGADQRSCGACPSGYGGDGETGCTDVDECKMDNGGCDARVACRNNVGAPVSCGACPIGFDDVDADGSRCVDLNECATGNGGCGSADHWTCSNNEGALPTCTDIDECATADGGCDTTYTRCENNIGAAPTCADIDECASDNGGCGADTLFTCSNNVGAAPSCQDINECDFNNGGCGNETYYSCSNNEGAAPTCEDIKECDSLNGGCDLVYESCTENVGAVPTCEDIKECDTLNGGCDLIYESCTENASAAPTCEDINECDSLNGGCDANADCADQTGAPPICTCHDGFTPAGNSCLDVNECDTDNGGCGNQACLNTDGSAVCSPIVSMADGPEHACALLSDGSVRCWGRDEHGRLGMAAVSSGQTGYSPSTGVDGISTAVELVVGMNHSCARLQDGTVQCWGQNNRGQIGVGSAAANVPIPTEVTGIGGANPKAIALGAGEEFTCAVLEDTSVACWGRNHIGQLGSGDNVDSNVPVQVQALDTTCTYVNDVRTGCTTQPTFAPLLGARAVSGGLAHTCVLGGTVTDFTTGMATTDDDMVRCWGEDDWNRLGHAIPGNQYRPGVPVSALPSDRLTDGEVMGIDLGYDHGCALLATGELACWGDNNRGELGTGDLVRSAVAQAVPGISSAVEMTVAREHTCVRLSSGQMQCWGRGNQGQLGDGISASVERSVHTPMDVPEMADAVLIAGSWESTCAIRSDGRGYCWGRNSNALLGLGRTGNRASPEAITKLDDAAQVSAGQSFACALQHDGRVKCWGRGADGQMGDGTNQAGNGPLPVPGITTATKVSAGRVHACALLQDRSVVCWGSNQYFQSGEYAGHPIYSPRPVTGLSGAVEDIAAGSNHTCAVIDGGTVQCWGRNNQSQLGEPSNQVDSKLPVTVPGISDAVQLSAGTEHTCALREGGLASCWGRSPYGECGVETARAGATPIPLDDVISVGAFGEASCAVVGDQATLSLQGVLCWGRNHEGQLGPDTAASKQATPAYLGLVTQTATQVTGSGGDWAHHACALLADKSVLCWGNADYGQLGDGVPQNFSATPQVVVGLSNAVQLTVGQNTSCAVLQDNTVSCWGRNNEYQVGDGFNVDRLAPTSINSLF